MNDHWHRRYIQMAGLVSSWSKDPSTKVGCILVNPESQIVVSTGFNGMPRGVEEYVEHHLHPRWFERPEKYLWIEHAERNAIFNAARFGSPTLGTVAYMNYAPTCLCTDCARAIIQAGIVAVVGPNRNFDGKGDIWEANLKTAQAMLTEAGVETLTLEDPR